MLLRDSPQLEKKKEGKAQLKVEVKFDRFQQVFEIKDERRKELLFAVSLFTACRKHYKKHEAQNVRQLPQDSLPPPQVVSFKT